MEAAASLTLWQRQSKATLKKDIITMSSIQSQIASVPRYRTKESKSKKSIKIDIQVNAILEFADMALK